MNNRYGGSYDKQIKMGSQADSTADISKSLQDGRREVFLSLAYVVRQGV